MQPSPFSILEERLSISTSLTSVKSDSSYNYYGVHDKILSDSEASIFVCRNSDATKSDVEKVLKKFVDVTVKDYLEEKGIVEENPKLGAWFTVRMTTPTDEYTTVPRWHQDGKMHHSDVPGEVNSKYAFTLLGNTTRIMDSKEEGFVKKVLDEEIAKLPSYEADRKAYWAYDEVHRRLIAERLKGQGVVDVPEGGIIRFSWGQVDSPVHSEPDMRDARVFVSVLYGSENEIKGMCELRGSEYRA